MIGTGHTLHLCRGSAVTALFATVCLCVATTTQAAPQYIASTLERPAEYAMEGEGPGEIRLADFNGDGRKDLMWLGWNESTGREILIYDQTAGGQFANEPSQRIVLKAEIIAYALADVRTEPGTELLFFTNAAAYSYSTRIAGYNDNITKLFDWPLAQSRPNERRLYFLGQPADFNNDGRPDLLLPAADHYGVFLAVDAEGYQLKGLVAKPYDDPANMANGLQSVFRGLFMKRPYDNISGLSKAQKDSLTQPQFNILTAGNWTSPVLAADVDGDQMADFVFLDDPPAQEGEQSVVVNGATSRSFDRQLNVALHASLTEDGDGTLQEFALALQRAPEAVRVVDLNNDQLDDIYIKGETTVSMYLNRNGSFDFSKADQVMKFDVLAAEERFEDLDGDGYPELCVTTFNVSALNAALTGDLNNVAIDRGVLIYKNRYGSQEAASAPRLFGGSPDSKTESRVLARKLLESGSIETLVSSMNPPAWIADMNADDIRDIAFVDQTGALLLHSIDQALSVGKNALWQFVPGSAIFGILAEQLNADLYSDFVLYHENAITVLVSQ